MRQVFYSFEYKSDSFRASKIKEIGAIEGNEILSGNSWESIKRGGCKEIKKWIDDNMEMRSCTIVLIGPHTASSDWVEYEIKKSWNDGKGVVGIYIHNLKDQYQMQSSKGKNPFDNIYVTRGRDKRKLSSIIKTYNPPFIDSKYVYNHIAENIEDWVEEAIQIRKNSPYLIK